MTSNKRNSLLRLAIPLLLILSALYRLHDEIVATKGLTITQPKQHHVHLTVSRTQLEKCIQVDQDEHHQNYTPSFIEPTQWMKGEGDIYSGMWWQSIDSMLKTNYSKLGFLEAISFKSFRNNERVIQTVDWLDMSVEHLSKYVKYFSGFGVDKQVSSLIDDRVAELIEGYINRTKKNCRVAPIRSAIPTTIAILPLRVSSLEKLAEAKLLMLQLSATLASLWAAGFPRAVVVGVSQNESIVANESFNLLNNHLAIRAMDLEYIQIDTHDFGLVPKVSLSRFQQVIMQQNSNNGDQINVTEKVKWLGNRAWEYVYFTEPDLILHIRPEAVHSLSLELQRGHLINAHRLQPLPHMQQFFDIVENMDSQSKDSVKLNNKLLPSKAIFGSIHLLDPAKGDACCDQGKFYPSNLEDPSSTAKKGKGCWLWEFCGFGSSGNHSNLNTWSSIVKRHEVLLMHPFLSIRQGTRIPVVHHGQRVCIPKRDGTSCQNFQ